MADSNAITSRSFNNNRSFLYGSNCKYCYLRLINNWRIEERTTAFNKNAVSGLESFVKSAPAGSDMAVAAVKSTVQATAAAMDSMTKAAKQVSEFTDASIKAATTATADAVKTAARKSNGATA